MKLLQLKKALGTLFYCSFFILQRRNWGSKTRGLLKKMNWIFSFSLINFTEDRFSHRDWKHYLPWNICKGNGKRSYLKDSWHFLQDWSSKDLTKLFCMSSIWRLCKDLKIRILFMVMTRNNSNVISRPYIEL